MSSSLRILIPAATMCVLLPLSLAAFRAGPLPSMTGGFGEQTCLSCHFGNDLNEPKGRLMVTGVPTVYTPARDYGITVTLTRKDLARGGFELAARFASGPRAGQQAGSWHLSGSRIQTVTSNTDTSLIFVQHTLDGTRAVPPGSLVWRMEWTAPEERTPVQFNIAANASNDDNSPLGDFIYIAEVASKPRN